MTEKMQAKANSSQKRDVFIVDDHPLVRQGLALLIDREPDLRACGQAGDAVQAVRDIELLKPDLVIVDLSLEESSGLELIKDLKVRCPGLPVLTLSMHDEIIYAERALRAGAKGYVMKQEATDRVVTAIRRVLSGQIWQPAWWASSSWARPMTEGCPSSGSATASWRCSVSSARGMGPARWQRDCI